MNKKILFFSSVSTKELFNTQQFYKIDINLLTKLGYEVILSNKISDSLKFWKYDILFSYFYRFSFFPAFIARLYGKKTYFTGGIDDLDKDYATKKRYFIQKIFYILCYWVSNSCIIVSHSDMNNVLKVLGKKKKLSFSEHTIQMDKFIVDENGKKENIFTTIAWMGNVNNVKRKGIDIALKVFSFLKKNKQFSNYKFVIIGRIGEGTIYLEELIKKYNLTNSIIFTGEIDEELKIDYLKRSRYYFQLSSYEGFGLAALEALASQNIVIHSSKGGLSNPIFSNGIWFNIDNDFEIECQKLLSKLYDYDNSKLENIIQFMIQYYDNNRRKNDFEKIIK